MSDSLQPWTAAQRAVLEARAARIVRSRTATAPRDLQPVVVVSASDAEVAVPESIVLGVRRLLQLTVVQGGPPALLGVFAEGEAVLPAFRLSTMLGLAPRPSERPFLLVLGRSAPELGVEVERVVGPDVCDAGSSATIQWDVAVKGETSGGVPVLDPDSLFHTSSLAVR